MAPQHLAFAELLHSKDKDFRRNMTDDLPGLYILIVDRRGAFRTLLWLYSFGLAA